MPATISRRKLATHAASRIAKGDSTNVVLRELAAYLLESHRVKEAELVVRDIETALLKSGTVVATVVSARPLTSETKQSLTEIVKQNYRDVKQIVLREVVDASVIAGVRLELPDKQLDTTVANKLEKLKV
jgi:F0F1-type ATP synthase delta subunit